MNHCLFLIMFLSTTIMKSPLDTITVYLKYNEFINIIERNQKITLDGEKLEQLIIENNNNVFNSSWFTGEDLPLGGIYFKHFDQIFQFNKIKELRLIDLFVKELPGKFIDFKELQTLEICLSRNADIDNIINILKQLPSLKYLDINGSRISEVQRNKINIEITKCGVKVDDYLMLKSQ